MQFIVFPQIQGFHISVLGTSLVDLEELFNVDTKTISFVFTGTGLGYLVGSFLCGFVYDHFNYEAQFFFASSAMGVACAIAPWTGNMVAFMVICSLQNIAAGFIDAGKKKLSHKVYCFKYVINIFYHHRK